jgi:hypothetical protein
VKALCRLFLDNPQDVELSSTANLTSLATDSGTRIFDMYELDWWSSAGGDGVNFSYKGLADAFDKHVWRVGRFWNVLMLSDIFTQYPSTDSVDDLETRKPSVQNILSLGPDYCRRPGCVARLQFVHERVGDLLATLQSSYTTTSNRITEHQELLKATRVLNNAHLKTNRTLDIQDLKNLSMTGLNGEVPVLVIFSFSNFI